MSGGKISFLSVQSFDFYFGCFLFCLSVWEGFKTRLIAPPLPPPPCFVFASHSPLADKKGAVIVTAYVGWLHARLIASLFFLTKWRPLPRFPFSLSPIAPLDDVDHPYCCDLKFYAHSFIPYLLTHSHAISFVVFYFCFFVFYFYFLLFFWVQQLEFKVC